MEPTSTHIFAVAAEDLEMGQCVTVDEEFYAHPANYEYVALEKLAKGQEGWFRLENKS